MKEILNFLFGHKTLSKDVAQCVLTNIAKGMYTHSEIAAFISVYLMRSITVEELSGFREALLDLCVPVDLNGYDTIDLCGTGGDGKNTFNLSTLASFVVAGAGGRVAKHGNVGVSSACGSSNIMEYFGYKFSSDPGKLKNELEASGICYLHAPLFNPAMKNVAPVRKELGVKTFFNMLGPMVNPSFPSRQMVGVYSLELARLYNYLYQDLNKEFAIVYSFDGYDEVSLTGNFQVITRHRVELLSPANLGMQAVLPEDISGGDSIPEAAVIFMNVLENKATRAQLDTVIANAAMGLACYHPALPVTDLVAMARESLESGKAHQSFRKLMQIQG
jgi:anthranilate phosphoribosyltransferase